MDKFKLNNIISEEDSYKDYLEDDIKTSLAKVRVNLHKNTNEHQSFLGMINLISDDIDILSKRINEFINVPIVNGGGKEFVMNRNTLAQNLYNDLEGLKKEREVNEILLNEREKIKNKSEKRRQLITWVIGIVFSVIMIYTTLLKTNNVNKTELKEIIKEELKR